MAQFTKKLKQEWLDKLKSGNYIQAFNKFTGENKEGKETRCCISVLDTCLNQKYSPFRLLDDVKIGLKTQLIITNDNPEYIKTGKTDYSNVIPIIEQLSTID